MGDMDHFPYFYGIYSSPGILMEAKAWATIQQGLTLNCRFRNLLSREGGKGDWGKGIILKVI
jgi:hypothetical protein